MFFIYPFLYIRGRHVLMNYAANLIERVQFVVCCQTIAGSIFFIYKHATLWLLVIQWIIFYWWLFESLFRSRYGYSLVTNRVQIYWSSAIWNAIFLRDLVSLELDTSFWIVTYLIKKMYRQPKWRKTIWNDSLYVGMWVT